MSYYFLFKPSIFQQPKSKNMVLLYCLLYSFPLSVLRIPPLHRSNPPSSPSLEPSESIQNNFSKSDTATYMNPYTFIVKYSSCTQNGEQEPSKIHIISIISVDTQQKFNGALAGQYAINNRCNSSRIMSLFLRTMDRTLATSNTLLIKLTRRRPRRHNKIVEQRRICIDLNGL